MSGRSGRNTRVAGVISIEGSAVGEYLESWRAQQAPGSLGLGPSRSYPAY